MGDPCQRPACCYWPGTCLLDTRVVTSRLRKAETAGQVRRVIQSPLAELRKVATAFPQLPGGRVAICAALRTVPQSRVQVGAARSWDCHPEEKGVLSREGGCRLGPQLRRQS